MRWAGHVVRIGEMKNAYRLLAGKPKGKRPPAGGSRLRCEDNIKMHLWDFGYEIVDWIHLAQDMTQW